MTSDVTKSTIGALRRIANADEHSDDLRDAASNVRAGILAFQRDNVPDSRFDVILDRFEYELEKFAEASRDELDTDVIFEINKQETVDGYAIELTLEFE